MEKRNLVKCHNGVKSELPGFMGKGSDRSAGCLELESVK
jgi:hypothetical protein